MFYLRKGTICNWGCFSSLISQSQIIWEGALRVNTPNSPSELALKSSVFKASHKTGSPLREESKLFWAGVCNWPIAGSLSHAHCPPAARAGLTAARISGHALDGITLIPNAFGSHPAQVQIFVFDLSWHSASGFGVLSPCTTHRHRGTLCPAKALHSLAWGYKAPADCRDTCRQSMGVHANLWVLGVQLGWAAPATSEVLWSWGSQSFTNPAWVHASLNGKIFLHLGMFRNTEISQIQMWNQNA